MSRVGHRSLVLVPIHLHHTIPGLPPPPNISSMDYDIYMVTPDPHFITSFPQDVLI